MLKHSKRYLQNTAILLTVLAGIKNITSALPLHIKLFEHFNSYYYTYINPQAVAMHGTLSFVTGFLMLILANRLYKRVRLAWVIELIALSASLLSLILKNHSILTPITLIEIAIIITLVLSYRDFSRRSDKLSAKWAFLLAGISIALVLLNATIGFMLMRTHYNEIEGFSDALIRSVELLIFMDTSASEFMTKAGRLYADFLITLNWSCIIFSTLMILKPIVYDPIVDKKDKEHTRSLVLAHGQNPMSYLALENDKRYFFGNTVSGVAAFTVAADVAVCCGDIICSNENAMLFLSEFMTFCKQNGWDLVLLNITDQFLTLYKTAGFGFVKYGEDACFKLSEYNLKGGKVAKVRAAINHANTAGITVCEYKPLEQRNTLVETEINEVSTLWFEGKKSSEMSFMLGGIGLENPMDRRYFIARDTSGKMLGFVVFLPYMAGQAYLADVTRRLPSAPQGVLEKIIYDAFMVMKTEGVEWGSMGLSPLANVRADDNKAIASRLFEFVYENLNSMYGFKSLHHAKEKYAPTEWQTRYMAYYPSTFTPRVAYSIVKAQNPKGISEFLLTQLKQQTVFKQG